MPPTYHLQNIRLLLTEGFPEEDLRAFCFDTPKFKPVHHELADLTGKKAIVQHLLEFAERQECLNDLLAWVKAQNPARYEKHQPYFEGDTAPTSAELAELRARYIELMIDRHQDLDFVGIPELKDRQALHLDEIFINLQAEIEIASEPAESPETVMRDEQVTIRHSRASTGLPRQTSKRRVSVNEALREHAKLVILGDPGAGKTTLLKYVTLAFAQNHCDLLDLPGDETRLPIFVRLYDYVAKQANHPGDYSLLDYLYTQAHEQLLLDLPRGFFEAELEQGQGCLCLDGLDELGGAGLRREVSAAVASLSGRYPRNRYLITSRLVGYEEAPLDRRDFIHHTVLPFGDDDIRRFVQKWYAAREKEPTAVQRQATHLIETILREPRLKDLAANPLMLTIMALVHRIEAELPHERVKLYDKCVTALIETWEQVKRLTLAEKERPYYQRRRHLLEQLAFWLHTQPLEGSGGQGRAREVAEGDLRSQIARFLRDDPQLTLDKRSAAQEAEAFIAMIKARTGLLVERGEGIYGFAHLTFQEYLAAAYLEYEHADSIDELWAAIEPHLHQPAWREVILLLLGSLNKFRKHPTALVRRIFESTDQYEALLHRHLFLAARALADRVRVDAALHEAIVDKLLQIAHSNEFGVSEALTALGALQGDEQAARELLALAGDSGVADWVRRDAAHALGQLGRADKAAELLLALAGDSSVVVGVRRDAAQTLGLLGWADEAVLAGLLALAGDSGVANWVRRDAAHTLGLLGRTDEAAEQLLALACDRTITTTVRVTAVQTLGQLGWADNAILVGLLALARDSTVDDWVRREVVQALGQLGRSDESVLAGLVILAHDNSVNGKVRITIAQILGQLGRTDEAFQLLLDLAKRSTLWGDELHITATHALAKLGLVNEAVSILLALAYNPNTFDWIRCDAAKVLGELGKTDESAEILLVLACNSTIVDFIRCDAARSLMQLGWSDEVISISLALANDTTINPRYRCDAAQILGQLNQADEAAKILLALTRDPTIDNEVHRDVVQALGQLGLADKAVLSELLTIAKDIDRDEWVRSDAIEALGQLNLTDETFLSELLNLAQNEFEDIRIHYGAYNSLKALLGGEKDGG